jgi:hypothetical protein
MQNVGAYETILKWTIMIFIMLNSKVIPEKIVGSLLKKTNIYFLIFC